MDGRTTVSLVVAFHFYNLSSTNVTCILPTRSRFSEFRDNHNFKLKFQNTFISLPEMTKWLILFAILPL